MTKSKLKGTDAPTRRNEISAVKMVEKISLSKDMKWLSRYGEFVTLLAQMFMRNAAHCAKIEIVFTILTYVRLSKR